MHATLPVNAEPRDDYGFAIVDLPEIAQAATIVHRGAMDNVLSSIQTLGRWIDSNGYRSLGHPRELYIEMDECGSAPVTELQEPIIAS